MSVYCYENKDYYYKNIILQKPPDCQVLHNNLYMIKKLVWLFVASALGDQSWRNSYIFIGLSLLSLPQFVLMLSQ